LMNVLPGIRSVEASKALRVLLITSMFFLPALLSAQSVPVTTNGIVSVTGTPRIYKNQYVLQQSDFGFFWLDTATLTAGHVQAVSRCIFAPPSDSNLNVIADCNSITDVYASNSQILVRMTSGQCIAQTRGCPGPRD